MDGKTIYFRTDRWLAEILKGKQKLSRTSLIQWLLFCNLSIPDIDEYLEEAQFFPITGYEKLDNLSNMVAYIYNLKDSFNVDISSLLLTFHEKLADEASFEDDSFRFPLRDFNSEN